jgi:hypothetical protein
MTNAAFLYSDGDTVTISVINGKLEIADNHTPDEFLAGGKNSASGDISADVD